MKKIYYEVRFSQNSPLRIGNTDSERTDSDLMLDGRGLPFIPGTSIAGVLRSMITYEDANRIFGYIEGNNCINSRIIIGDAVLPDAAVVGKYKRDGVALNEWGMVENKFDFEVAESKDNYVAIFEWSGNDEDYEKDIIGVLEPLFGEIIETGINFGAKTTRGYGFMSVQVRKKEFDFPGNYENWLKFSPYAAGSFSDPELKGLYNKTADRIEISADISIDGNFSVSNPTSSREPIENGASPDKVPLKNFNNLPVISGASWAGSFRHHMNALCRSMNIEEENVNLMFGIDDARKYIFSKSKIRFEETEISCGQEIVISRNAIDRFTSAPKNTGLFTAEVCYGGTGKLRISFNKNTLTDLQKQLLAASLSDLQLGLLTAGGEGGIGRGRIH
ncbi:MAG: hypothetical protein J6Y89_02940, partial [Lachnospiraceae bacterium]|nr:hypothetical protein [Lachnospiraceae bacterium]